MNQVRISFKRLSNNQYWSGSSTGSGFSIDVPLLGHDARHPRWHVDRLDLGWTPRSSTVPGDFQILVQAIDAAGNVDNSTPNVRFTVTANGPDTVEPDTTISTPANGATLPTGMLAITGTATDNAALGSVRIGIRDTNTNQWWSGSVWTASQAYVNATLAAPGAASSNWSYSFNAPTGSFEITAAAVDTSNVVDTTPAGPTTFTAAGAPDTSAPVTTVTSPLNNSSQPVGVVIITGNVTDNVAATTVRVSIRNNATLQWWNGTNWGPFTWVPATLTSPGSPTSGWTYTFNAPAAGSFGLQVRSIDGAGNLGANSTWRSFILT